MSPTLYFRSWQTFGAFLCLFLFFAPVRLFAQFSEVWEKTFEPETLPVFHPFDLWLISEDRFLITDQGNQDGPVKLVDMEREIILNEIRSGKGPGEVHHSRYKRMTRFSNGDILLYDSGNLRLNRYSADFEFLGNIRGKPVETQLYQVGLANDSTLVLMGPGENILQAFRLDGTGSVSDENRLWTISLDQYEALAALENFLIRQTFFVTNDRERLYMASEYSSLVMAIDEEGIEFMTHEPENVPLPVTESEGGGVYSLPDSGKHQKGARDVAVSGDYLYVLYKSETMSRLAQMSFLANPDKLIDKMNHTSRILVYDNYNGNYLRTLELPMQATKLAVNGNYLYLYNDMDGLPHLAKYSMN